MGPLRETTPVKKPEPITIVVGEIYRHGGRDVLIAEQDPGGVWLAPASGKPYHLPWHKLGQLRPVPEDRP